MDVFSSICTDIITLVSLILDPGVQEQFIQIIEFLFVYFYRLNATFIPGYY